MKHTLRQLRFNGDFEYELAAVPGPYQPTKFSLELNRLLGPLMAWLGGPDDVLLEAPFDPAPRASSSGIGRSTPVARVLPKEALEVLAKRACEPPPAWPDALERCFTSGPSSACRLPGPPPSPEMRDTAGDRSTPGVPPTDPGSRVVPAHMGPPLRTRGWSLELLAGRYVPWGVTPTTRLEAHGIDPALRLPPIEVVRRVQDRRFGLELEFSLGSALEGSRLLTTLEEVDAVVAASSGPFVIKHPYGVAGRERVLRRVPQEALPESARGWCRRALEQAGVLVYEPWVEKVRELGLQWWIPEVGAPYFLGAVTLLTEPNGAYRGHLLGALELPAALLRPAVAIVRRVQAEGYFGPLGIDAFEYRTLEGEVRFRPLVELNARITMGMVALALEQLLPPGGTATWLHLNARDGLSPELEAALRDEPYQARTLTGTLLTGPPMRDGLPAARVSVITVREHLP